MKKLIPALLSFGLLLSSLPAFADFKAERYQPESEAVKKRLYIRKSKQELALSLGLSVNDPFYQIYHVNLSYSYHIAEWFSLGVLVAGSFDSPTGLTRQLEDQNGSFKVKPDVRRPFFFSTAGVEARFAPVYGKFNVFSSGVVHYDIFFLLGGGIFLTNPPQTTAQQGEGMGIAPYGSVGVGQRYFLLRFLAFRWEYRLMMMPDSFAARNQTLFRLNMDLNLGFSFFF